MIRKDRKGVVADIASSILKSNGNIEQTSLNDVRGLFGINSKHHLSNENYKHETYVYE
jgi:predicted amino acid-binding ACT domain protein